MFGKRRTAVMRNEIPPHPGPDPDGVTRVFPLEVWEGEQGKWLRELGFFPDDEANILPNISEFKRRFKQRESELDRYVAQMNAKLPAGTEVIPYAMVPWSIWNPGYAEAADFLLRTFNFMAVDPWNTILLPADQKSGLVLDLPQHPRGYPPGYEDACARLLLELKAEYIQKTRPILEKGADASREDIDRHSEIREDATRRIAGMAAVLASKFIGEDAYRRSKTLFG